MLAEFVKHYLAASGQSNGFGELGLIVVLIP